MIRNFFQPTLFSNAIPTKKKTNIFPIICKNPPWINIDVNKVYICGIKVEERYIGLKARPAYISPFTIP